MNKNEYLVRLGECFCNTLMRVTIVVDQLEVPFPRSSTLFQRNERTDWIRGREEGFPVPVTKSRFERRRHHNSP